MRVSFNERAGREMIKEKIRVVLEAKGSSLFAGWDAGEAGGIQRLSRRFAGMKHFRA